MVRLTKKANNNRAQNASSHMGLRFLSYGLLDGDLYATSLTIYLSSSTAKVAYISSSAEPKKKERKWK